MSRKLRILCSHINYDYEVIYNGFSWVSDGRRPYVIIRKKAGSKYISTYRPFSSALKNQLKQSRTASYAVTVLLSPLERSLISHLSAGLKSRGKILLNFHLKRRTKQAMIFRRYIFPRRLIQKTKAKFRIMLTQCVRASLCPTDIRKTSFQPSALLITSEE